MLILPLRQRKIFPRFKTQCFQFNRKRVFDIAVSVFSIILFSLPMIFIALMLKFKEKHAIIFKQTRVGLFGNNFSIYKFQTLVDGKATGTGKILRKTGLDELPQFFNVLLGDMSVVGPRALTGFDIKRLKWNDEFHSKRWSIKPGITGFAQLYGGQHKKTSWFWDCQYIKQSDTQSNVTQSINTNTQQRKTNGHNFTDIKVIALTFLMSVIGKTKTRQIIFSNTNLK